MSEADPHLASTGSVPQPYPGYLEHRVTLAGGDTFTLRPIRPDDEASLAAMQRRITPEHLRLRFFSWMTSVPTALTARLSRIDYDLEMALVAVEENGDFAAVARLILDPDLVRAEFAVIVRSDLHGRGLGHALMVAILEYARGRGVNRVEGEVLMVNTHMLSLARELGARVGASDVSGVVTVAFDLPSS